MLSNAIIFAESLNTVAQQIQVHGLTYLLDKMWGIHIVTVLRLPPQFMPHTMIVYYMRSMFVRNYDTILGRSVVQYYRWDALNMKPLVTR